MSRTTTLKSELFRHAAFKIENIFALSLYVMVDITVKFDFLYKFIDADRSVLPWIIAKHFR